MKNFLTSKFIKDAAVGGGRTNDNALAASFLNNYDEVMEIIGDTARLGIHKRFSSNLLSATINRTIGVTMLSYILDKEYGVKFATVDSFSGIDQAQAQMTRARAQVGIDAIQKSINDLTVADLPDPEHNLVCVHPEDAEKWVSACNDFYATVDSAEARLVNVEVILDPESFSSILLDIFGDVGLGLAYNMTVVPFALVQSFGLTQDEINKCVFRLSGGKMNDLPEFASFEKKAQDLAGAVRQRTYVNSDIRRALNMISWKDCDLVTTFMRNMSFNKKSFNVMTASVLNDFEASLQKTFRTDNKFLDLLLEIEKMVERKERHQYKNVILAEGNVECRSTRLDIMNRKVLLKSTDFMGQANDFVVTQRSHLNTATFTSHTRQLFSAGANVKSYSPQTQELMHQRFTLSNHSVTFMVPETIDYATAIKRYAEGERAVHKISGTHIVAQNFIQGGVTIPESGTMMFEIIRRSSNFDVHYTMLPVLRPELRDTTPTVFEIKKPPVKPDQFKDGVNGGIFEIDDYDPVVCKLWSTRPDFILDFIEEVSREALSRAVVEIAKDVPKVSFTTKSSGLIDYMLKYDQRYDIHDKNSDVMKYFRVACVLMGADCDTRVTFGHMGKEYTTYLDTVIEDFNLTKTYHGLKSEDILNAIRYMTGMRPTKAYLTFDLAIKRLRELFQDYDSPIDAAYILNGIMKGSTPGTNANVNSTPSTDPSQVDEVNALMAVIDTAESGEDNSES